MTNFARTNATSTYFDLRNLTRNKAKLIAHTFEQLDVALTIVAKREALSQIDLSRVQTIDDYITQKVLSANGCKLFREPHHNRLFDTQNTVFGSGDPNRPDPAIPVSLTDAGLVHVVVPEPASLSLLGFAGLLALRRRRAA